MAAFCAGCFGDECFGFGDGDDVCCFRRLDLRRSSRRRPNIRWLLRRSRRRLHWDSSRSDLCGAAGDRLK